MEGIWIYEYLLMTLLWQSKTDGAAGREKGGKRGKSQREKSDGDFIRGNEKEHVDEKSNVGDVSDRGKAK